MKQSLLATRALLLLRRFDGEKTVRARQFSLDVVVVHGLFLRWPWKVEVRRCSFCGAANRRSGVQASVEMLQSIEDQQPVLATTCWHLFTSSKQKKDALSCNDEEEKRGRRRGRRRSVRKMKESFDYRRNTLQEEELNVGMNGSSEKQCE